MKGKTPLLLTTAILVPVLVVFALGACSEGDTETVAVGTPNTTVTSVETTTVMPQTTTVTAASPTTAPSRPITAELPPGATRLEDGHVQVTGYIFEAFGTGLMAGGGPFNLYLVPAEVLADEEDVARALKEIDPDPATDTPAQGYQISPTVSITVSTLGDGEEQALTLDQFLGIWSPSPPEGSEHLAYALWRIEYGETPLVLSITEYVP
jgi:hypothetical protein